MSDLFERISKLSPKRLALLAMDLQAKLDAAERTKAEPIAIVGMSCRFPGANSPEAYWQVLRDGVDAIREIPPSRWDADAYYDPNPEMPGKIATRWGGFLDQIDQFEPAFFGIAPREATSMDPQQRLLLEVAWEALEHANIAPNTLHGSQTGVFVGICNGDYGQMLMNGDDQNFDMYLATGSAYSVASGRLSYALGLQGPAVSVDTACSSSLVAVHLAVQSLRDHACRAALAGGVNIILSPKTTMTLSRAKMMAADGRCKAFDARADGFVRGEGCGLVVLKRLSDAVNDGDTVLAVIRGSAINQDGRSNGLTAPNGPSQVAVIRAALADAGVQPDDVSYVETHGTGTSLGDPIEAQALGEALGPGRSAQRRLTIGSAKTNLGHLESAAGIAGLIKVVLSLQHAEIPPLLHLTQPNPYIPWDELPLDLPTQRIPWIPINGQRVAGVSSFGFSGTNAHIVLEAAPVAAPRDTGVERPLHLLKLSARSDAGLREMVDQIVQYLAAHPDAVLADVAYSAAVGRSDFAHRVAIVADTTERARDALIAFNAGEESDDLTSGVVQGQRAAEVVFLFTGHGSQYVDMGRTLYTTQPVFRAALDRCATLLEPLMDQPLLDVLFAKHQSASGDSLLNVMTYSQPALFAIEYALAELWQSWGVRPTAVAGHSAGEYVAAVVAGVLSLEDGLRLIAARGRLMGSLPPNGEMAAVFATEARVTQALAPHGRRVSIAAINGPQSIALSGTDGALEAVLDELRAEGVEIRRLAIPIAAHSPQVDPILAAFEQVAATVQYNPPQLDVVSGMTGQLATGDDLVTASYWRRHLREPVRFADALRTLYDQGRRIFVEIGPHPTLLGMSRHIVPEHECAWLPSLRSGHDEWAQMLHSAAALYTHGVNLAWAAFDAPYVRHKVALPTYPFQRERYWATVGSGQRATRAMSDRHPLLGGRLRSPAVRDIVFQTQLGASWPAFLDHHRIYGAALLPSPAYIEMVLAGADEALGPGPFAVDEFAIREALILPEEGERNVQLVLRTEEDGPHFEIFSADQRAESWTLHASGRVSRVPTSAPYAPPFMPELVQTRCQERIDGATYYERLQALGLEFGEGFRGITDIWRCDGEALGRVVLPDLLANDAHRYQMHPALLDACFHLLGASLRDTGEQAAYLLIAIEHFQLHARPATRLWNHTVLHPGSDQAQDLFTGDIRLYDEEGHLVAEALGLQLKLASREALMRATRQFANDWLYDVQWQPKPLLNQQASLSSMIPTTEVIAEHLADHLSVLNQQHNLGAYLSLQHELEQLSSGYVMQALHRLGWSFIPGERITTDAFADRLGVLPRHRRLLDRMLAMLEEDSIVRRDGASWEVIQIPPVPDDLADAATRLRTHFPSGSAEVTLTERCGRRLADVLCGQVEPLQLLFPDGSQETTEQIYRDSPSALVCNALTQEAIAAAIQQLPADRPVRVLEIGGGTAATTRSVLPILPESRAEYWFTDISPLFVARAEERFSDMPFMHYKVFDIECAPQSQDLPAGYFDLVIAANVFHATADLRQSLDHAQQLLAPGGLLLLVEGTRPGRWVDITFGLTEGWWHFTDTDLRQDYPLLDREHWLDLLASARFEEATAFPAAGEADIAGQAIMLSRAPQSMSKDKGTDSWLILADKTGVGQHFAALLRQRGERVIEARSGDNATSNGTRFIEPGDAIALRQVISDLPPGRRRVVYLWGLDMPVVDTLRVEQIDEVVATPTGSALNVAQLLIDLPGMADMWIVTRGAQAAGGMSVTPTQAPLWGLGRVIAIEHPEHWGGLIDLAPNGDPLIDATALLTEITQTDGEDQVVLRGDERLVARLVRSGLPSGSPLVLRPDASYMITGGLGGLGLKLARWMAERGAGSLVLLGRNGLPPRDTWSALPAGSREAAQIAEVRAIEALGTTVYVLAADVTDRAAMQPLVARFGVDLPPLHGIIHAAADLSNWSVASMPQEALRAMLQPKVAGTWLLHELTRDLPLDFFVLFSSTTALWGARDLAHYAAANQFLDAFAHFRHALHLPALSINWGTWDEMRVASDADRRNVASFGLHPMPSDQALHVLGDLLRNSDTAQRTVASVDWNTLKLVYEARRTRPFLSLIATRQAARPQPKKNERPALLRRLEDAKTHERRDIIVTFLRDEVARALGIQPAHRIDSSQGLFEMGMDSLMSVELKGRIETAVGTGLPSTLTFNYPNIDALADFLMEVLSAPSDIPDEPPTSPQHAEEQSPDTLPLDNDDLSEDDLALLLATRLAKIR